jgi:hypothetical protein
MDLTGFMMLIQEGVYAIAQRAIKQAVTVVIMPILKDLKKTVKIRKIQFLKYFLFFLRTPFRLKVTRKKLFRLVGWIRQPELEQVDKKI